MVEAGSGIALEVVGASVVVGTGACVVVVSGAGATGVAVETGDSLAGAEDSLLISGTTDEEVGLGIAVVLVNSGVGVGVTVI